VTYTGHCLKYSIENLLTEDELKLLAPSKRSSDDLFFNKANPSPGKALGSDQTATAVPEGVLRMQFKIREFFGVNN
jgi:hypothetical protein